MLYFLKKGGKKKMKTTEQLFAELHETNQKMQELIKEIKKQLPKPAERYCKICGTINGNHEDWCCLVKPS